MALHVPKAPGFAQMLKEGAKVRKGGRRSEVGESAKGSGGRSEGEGRTNEPGVLPRHSGRRERRFQKGRCSREGSAAEARGHFGSLWTPGRVKRAETASGGRGRRHRVLYLVVGQIDVRPLLHFSSIRKTGVMSLLL